MKAQQGMTEVDDETIRNEIENLGEQVKNADPKKSVKRAVATLFDELRIGPKEGFRGRTKNNSQRRSILPLTGIFVASPRGFEPLLPA